MFETIAALLGIALGGAGGYFYRKKKVEERNKNLKEKSDKILSDAESKSKEILYDARNEALKIQEEVKKEEQVVQKKLTEIENRLIKKEETLDQRNESVDKLREELDVKVASVKKLKEDVEEIYKSQSQELEKISALSKEEAKKLLLAKVEEDSKEDIVHQIKKVEQDFKEKAQEKAKWMIANSIARLASETTAESTATIVNLPSDDLKGRIIGREGRNINAFEQITGVDVIIDDTPGSILLSGFDLVRRYVAKVTLERLLEDGRIHPARIEEMYAKVKDEVNVLIKELGEKAVMQTGVTGFHPNLMKLLGRLKFRITHGQNALKHSVEVSLIAGSLAAEVGADEGICRKAGLLHDIGKAVDHEVPGHHAKIGADIARKFGLSDEVVHAIEAHHSNPEPESLEAQLVQAANLISNSRPGANKENLDGFVRRLHELENICKSFESVERAFAIQAGTEVRIYVDPTKIDDLESVKLSYKIARKIEQDLQHPGPVKVHVIREVREEAFAT